MRVFKHGWFHYPQLPARPAQESGPAPGLSARNAALLANQVRVNSGATYAHNLMGDAGRIVFKRLDTVASGPSRGTNRGPGEAA